MRKLISLILVLAMVFCLICAHAEQYSFLIRDWKLLYTYEDVPIAEQIVTVREDSTFELTYGGESGEGTWKFDGETLVLSAEDDDMALVWNEEEYQFAGEFSGFTVIMTVHEEAENGDNPDGKNGMLAGGWTVAEDPAITDDFSNAFWQAMDSYQTGTITIAYTPYLLLGTQVVAGTNYAVLCRASEINKGASWVVVYLYVDLEGNASVLEITDLPLGL